MDLLGKGTSNQCSGDEGSSAKFECFPTQDHEGDLVLMSNNATVMVYPKKEKDTVSLEMCRQTQEAIALSASKQDTFRGRT